MFERFTEKSIQVILLAQEESRRLGHSLVGSEQILIGLILEDTSLAANVLKELGLTVSSVRAEVEKIVGRGAGFVGTEIPFTPKAKQLLEQAIEEARQLSQDYIGPEHLLLGLTQDAEGVAAKILPNLGIDIAHMRTQIIRIIRAAAAVPVGVGPERETKSPRGDALSEFGRDLTQLAIAGKIDPVVGRAKVLIISFTKIYITAKTMMSLIVLLIYFWALLVILNRLSSQSPSA